MLFSAKTKISSEKLNQKKLDCYCFCYNTLVRRIHGFSNKKTLQFETKRNQIRANLFKLQTNLSF